MQIVDYKFRNMDYTMFKIELEFMGIRDYFTDDAICLIEWPEKGEGFLPRPSVAVQISSSQRGRCVTLEANSAEGIHLIGQLKGL